MSDDGVEATRYWAYWVDFVDMEPTAGTMWTRAPMSTTEDQVRFFLLDRLRENPASAGRDVLRIELEPLRDEAEYERRGHEVEQSKRASMDAFLDDIADAFGAHPAPAAAPSSRAQRAYKWTVIATVLACLLGLLPGMQWLFVISAVGLMVAGILVLIEIRATR